MQNAPGIGTPQSFIDHIRTLEKTGVDQVIFLQQAGRMAHSDICHSLELFSRDVLSIFAAGREEREARKAAELAPYIEAAMKRKKRMEPLEDGQIPIVPASKPKLPDVPAEAEKSATAAGS